MYNFELKFGKKKVKFQIEDKNYLNTLSLTKKVSQLTEEEIVRKSISNPIGSDTLDIIINEEDKICIVISDITRMYQRPQIYLPILIDEILKAGGKEENIFFLCSLGMHRKQTDEEHKSLLNKLDCFTNQQVKDIIAALISVSRGLIGPGLLTISIDRLAHDLMIAAIINQNIIAQASNNEKSGITKKINDSLSPYHNMFGRWNSNADSELVLLDEYSKDKVKDPQLLEAMQKTADSFHLKHIFVSFIFL